MAFKLRSQAPTKQVKQPKKKEQVSLETKVDNFLGGVQGKAVNDSDLLKDEEPIDNIRHASAGRYTQEAVSRRLGGGILGNITGIVASNALGTAHEAKNIIKDKRPWGVKLRESGEDMINNAFGSLIGAAPVDAKTKTKTIKEMSFKNRLPDGYQAEKGDFEKGFIADAYFKNKKNKNTSTNNNYFPTIKPQLGGKINKKKK